MKKLEKEKEEMDNEIERDLSRTYTTLPNKTVNFIS